MRIKSSVFAGIVTLFSLVATAGAQASDGAQLAALLAALPEQVHSKTFDMLTFSRATGPLLESNPSDVAPVIAVAAQNLKDPDPLVRRYTLVLLGVMAGRQDVRQLMQPLVPTLNQLLQNDSEGIKRFVLIILAGMGPSVPDTSVPIIETILATRGNSETLTVGAAEVLMRARPKDEGAQAAVLRVVNDSQLPLALRERVVYRAGQPGVGPMLTDALVGYITQPGVAPELRDGAISAIDRIGPTAIARVQSTLQRLADDPNETLTTRQGAEQALRSQRLAAEGRKSYPPP